MFRQIIFVIMLGWFLVLSGCAVIDKGHNIEGEDYRSGYPPRGGYSRTTPHKALVSEACNIEANNLVIAEDFMGDDRARRVYFSQCMLRNGYDTDGNYVGILPK
jgi:hypothetical protein